MSGTHMMRRSFILQPELFNTDVDELLINKESEKAFHHQVAFTIVQEQKKTIFVYKI